MPEVGAAPSDDQLAAVAASLARLESGLGEAADRAAARERVIDRQHEEIERLRQGQRTNQLRPTVTDLYRLRNDLLHQAATVRDLTGEEVSELLRSYADTVEEALQRCGIGVLPREPGTEFVPSRQQVASFVETVEPHLDGLVAEVVRDGYEEVDGTLVARARVKLYRHTPAPATDG